MGYLDSAAIAPREKRQPGFSAYVGENGELMRELGSPEPRGRIRAFSQCSGDEIIDASRLLATIKDACLVTHGAIGCTAALLGFCRGSGNAWYSTNLDEKDTIMGGDEKLRQVIERAWAETSPKAVFVVGTPVTAINNDDVKSAILDLEGELGAKIVFVNTDGFKSRTALNGTDLALFALAKHVVAGDPGEKNARRANLIRVGETAGSVREIERLLEKLGIGVNTIPAFASVEAIENAGISVLSVALNDDASDVFLRGVEEKTGTPSIASPTPAGLGGTAEFLRIVARRFDLSAEAESLILEEERRARRLAGDLPLSGRNAFIDAPTADAYALASVVCELGGEVIGVSVPYIGDNTREGLNSLDEGAIVHVGEGQPFEIVNILEKRRPDLYICSVGKASFAAEIGIPAVSTATLGIYGYEGMAEFAAACATALKHNSFASNLSGLRGLYRNEWLKRNPNWHVKLEVN